MEGEREGGDALSEADGSRLHRVLRRAVDVRPEEVRATLLSAMYFFLVLSGWFVLRPMRDAVAASSGATNLSWLFTGTLGVMLVCIPVFSSLVVKFPVRRFIAITYHFFVVNLVAFYVLMRVAAPVEGSVRDIWIGRGFFVWTSVFNLFVTSVFWSFMADYFRSGQAKRLFGFIAVGGSLGSVAGSAVTVALARQIGTASLLLVTAVLLEIAVLVVTRFPARPTSDAGDPGAAEPDRKPIGGSIWAGFTHVAGSPYLAGIAVFQILLTIGSTFLYFEQASLVGSAFADRASRTTALAQIELAAQALTLVTQVFLTGRVIRWIGLAGALAFLPVVTLMGFGMLGAVPVFASLAIFTVLRRAGNFALTNPAMEVLWTVVRREDKYKAKSFVETFLYRSGDLAGAWTYAGMTALGLGFTGIAFASVPVAAVWLVLGVWLGRRQAVLAQQGTRGE